jgi:MauM/NapG family ferredoxin protein
MFKLRKVRITSQIVFFILFAGSFFFLNRNPTGLTFDSEWFLKLNPLVGLTTSIASRSFVVPALWFGLGVLVVTLLFGRLFCGHVCPLGALIDFSDRYLVKKMYNAKRRPPLFFQRAKYFILFALATLSFFGVIFPLFMDPISLLTRIFTLIAFPFINILQTDLAQPVAKLIGLQHYAYATIQMPLFYSGLSAIVLLAFIFGAGYWDRRFWCQYICPSGAFFGLLSRWSFLRRHVIKEKCNECKLCTNRTCPTRAIHEKDVTKTSQAECIVCGNCSADKKMCTEFNLGSTAAQPKPEGPDIHRRHVIAGVCAGVIMTPVFRAEAMRKRDDTGRLIRPPGALPEKDFLTRCIACGECMKACPMNALNTCTLSDGLSRLNTPKLVPRIGGCEEKCYVCGHVCPTGAIRPLIYEEKRFAKIGTAVVNRHKCLAWEQNKECLVCDEVCPYNAITAMIVETTTGKFKVPVVNEDLCIGCGMCEQLCPIFDVAAIEVFRFGENRLAYGQYANADQKKKILEQRMASDQGIGESMKKSEGGGVPAGFDAGNQQGTPPGFEAAGPADLPPGFSN